MFPQTKLQDAEILASQPKAKPYKLSEGGGLYLLVSPNGAKYWQMKYRFEGKERKYAIGVYPTVSIKAAIIARDRAKEVLRCGIDPVENRKQLKKAKAIRSTPPKVFEYTLHDDGSVTITKRKQSLTIAQMDIEALLHILKLSLKR